MQYDLTNTLLAELDGLLPPSEAELLAVTVGLLLVEDCELRQLNRRALVLTTENCNRVATIIQQRLPPLARELGSRILEARLRLLVGLCITSDHVERRR